MISLRNIKERTKRSNERSLGILITNQAIETSATHMCRDSSIIFSSTLVVNDCVALAFAMSWIPPVALQLEFHERDCLSLGCTGSSIVAVSMNGPWMYLFARVAVVDSSHGHYSMVSIPNQDSVASRRSDWAIADVWIPFEMAFGTCLYLSATAFFSLTFFIRRLPFSGTTLCEFNDSIVSISMQIQSVMFLLLQT